MVCAMPNGTEDLMCVIMDNIGGWVSMKVKLKGTTFSFKLL